MEKTGIIERLNEIISRLTRLLPNDQMSVTKRACLIAVIKKLERKIIALKG
jgi:hypothetical protein